MFEENLSENIAPKGSNAMRMNSASNKLEPYIHSSILEETLGESNFLLEQLGVPLLKLNQQMQFIMWNKAFVDVIHAIESDLETFSLIELSEREPIFECTLQLVQEVAQTQCKSEDEYEEGEKLIRIHVVPSSVTGLIYVLYEDLSLQRQFEQLLTFHHQMEAVSHIAASVAHELRNPLSVIKGFLQLGNLTKDYNKYYDTIMSELNRMNGIIEDFLSVSRKKIDQKWQSPHSIMQSLQEIIKAECLLHNVESFFDITPTEHLVYVNEAMIKQVMLNLLRNSIEAYGESNTNS